MTQTDTPAAHPLVERITRLRARVRLVLALFGGGVLIASAGTAIFLLILADYLFHLPTPLRLLLLLAWIIAAATLAWRVLVLPLMTRLTDRFLASRIENVHKELSDELMSAVQFIHAGTFRTNALAARHVDATAARTAAIRFEEAIDFRRSAKALAGALLLCLIVAVVAAMNPRLTHIALSRWFSTQPLDWPRITRVAFVWQTPTGDAPQVIPIGEQLLIRAKVLAGGSPRQRVWLTTWSDNRRAVSELMTFQPEMSSNKEFIYERTLAPEGDRTFSLKLAAGDDTEQDPVQLRLAPRPIISELFASITPPPYVRNVNDPARPAPAVVVDLLAQAGRAVEGATISLHIKATKPFQTDEHGAPLLRLLAPDKTGGDEELPLAATRKLLEPALAELSFPAAKTLQARLVMRDQDDFDNRVGGTLAIDVVPDGLPSLIITEPRRMVERTPTATVDLAIQATDDLGLDGLKLVAEKFDAKPGDPPLLEEPLPWADRTVDTASGNTTGHTTYAWNLATLKLQPGARVSFYAMVQDNYEVAGKRHPWVKSPPLSLQIRSDADIAEARRRDLNEVKERIRTLRTQQEQTKNQTDAIQKAAAATGITTAQQKDQLAQLAQQQSEQAATANAIQQKVAQVQDDLKQNNMAQNDLGKLAADVAAGMKDVAQNNMPAAAGELNRAHDAAGNTDPQNEQSKKQAQQTADAAANAGKQQANAIATMDNLIHQLGAAGDFEAVRQELRKINDQQNALNQQTRDLSAKTIGRRPEELPPDTKNQLDTLAAQQKDLANQTSALLQKMDKAADQLKQNDPAASDSLQRAAQAGQENQVSPSQGNAGSSIARNQMSNASGSQAQAQRGLQQMMQELDKNDQRQLEQLARQLQELIEQVRQLRAAEETLNKDTLTAGATAPAPALLKLGDRQGQLQMNTIVVQKKAENTKNAQPAAGDIRDAGDHMSTAAAALYGSKQPAALDPQTQAIASLDAAIKKLSKEKDKIDSQLNEKDLASFVKQYQAIQADQKTVKTAADKIDTRRQAARDKQVDRLGMIELTKLAGRQSALMDQINALSTEDKLKEFAVIVWMNSQITEAMSISQERMKKLDTGTPIAAAQQTAIDRIQDIIDALKEEQKRQSDFQNEQNNAGGGGGSGGKKPLVPPIAQLKLLKAMQLVINARTVDVNKGIEATTNESAKADLQGEAAKLGQKQGEIRTIADKIIQQMKQ